MRRSGVLVVIAAVACLVVLAGLAAIAGGVGVGPTATASRSTSTFALGSGAPTATSGATATPGPTIAASASPLPPGTAVLVGAGDIANCALGGDEATAGLLDQLPGTVFTAGDNAYGEGTAAQFADCYGPTWGRHRERTRPAAGNHDWLTPGGSGYLGYFGTAATNADGQTWYSYDLESWHVIVLDSNCSMVGGCGPESPQGTWLAADLAANHALCTVAIWHHPRFSSGEHGDDGETDSFWRAFVAAGGDLVISGHDHDYERFAPQNADGDADPAGIREIVAGTGGAELRAFVKPVRNSMVRSSIAHGVLELTLQQGRFGWRFISTDGSFSDQGSATCH